ncbi:MAG TPA: pilus assembly protein TadG-related protein [Candidatus Dormibacteraeota bacterium]|nr:pilus assembly protein TadG-related protein [Candidatus Dormibacteraeota bacterium]
MRSNRRGRQRGQVLIVFALMGAVLIGFCGLALDGATANFNQRSLQETADAAALAAAYQIYTGGTEAKAQTVGQNVASDDLCSAGTNCTIGFTFYDVSGVVTATASLVDTVKASLSQPYANHFIHVAGASGSTTIAANATAKVSQLVPTGQPPTLPCGLCLLSPATTPCPPVATCTGLLLPGSSVTVSVTAGDLDVNGQVWVGGSPDAISAAPGKLNVAGSPNTFGTATYTPAATTGTTAIADPLAYLGEPTAVGAPQGSDVTVSTTSTIQPGIYGCLNFGANNVTMTLAPGIYVFVPRAAAGCAVGGSTTPGVYTKYTGDVVAGTGVVLYFTCGTYPTPADCATTGQVGATLAAAQPLTLNLNAPTSGTWNHLLYYLQRHNTAQVNFAQTLSGTSTGAFYGADSLIILRSSAGGTALGSPIVASSLDLPGGNISFTSALGASNTGTRTAPGNLIQ